MLEAECAVSAAADAFDHRALRSVGRFRAIGRRGPRRRRCRRRRIDVDVMDGRFVQHHHRAGRAAGDPSLDGEAPQRSFNDRRAGALSRRLRRRRRRSSAVQAEPGSTIHLHRVLSRLRALGKKSGVVLDPATPPELVEYVLHLCDVILVMTVNPGFGGQNFLPEMLPKIRRLREMCAERALHPVVEVDGGENASTAGRRPPPAQPRSLPARRFSAPRITPRQLPTFARGPLRRPRRHERVSFLFEHPPRSSQARRRRSRGAIGRE